MGLDPSAIDRISLDLLNNYQRLVPGAGAETRGASAIDIALWDLFGKTVNQPVWKMLGGLSRDLIPTYNTCAGYQYVRSKTKGKLTKNWGIGDQPLGPYEDLDAFMNRAGELAIDLKEQGIGAMKIWPFDSAAEKNDGAYISSSDIRKGLEPFEKIRAAVGDDMEIMLELHSLWQPTAVRRIFDAVQEFRPFWYEDPIKMTNFDALARLTNSTSVPIAARETVATRPAFLEMMQKNAADYVIIDIGWCGGLSEAKKIGTMAEAFQRQIAIHDCVGPIVFTASCHLSMNAPNALFQESVRVYYSSWYKDLVTVVPRIENGYVYPNTGPGLGTELHPDVFKRDDLTIRHTDLE